MDPECFAPEFASRLEKFINENRQLNPVDPEHPVQIPGDFSRKHIARSEAEGGLLYHKNQIEHMKKLSEQLNVPIFSFKSYNTE